MTAAAAIEETSALARALLTDLGRPADAPPHRIAIAHRDPIFPTALRAGEAAAAVLAAQATAAADLWCLRGGAPQQIDVDVRAAAASLVSFALQRATASVPLRQPPPTVAFFATADGQWVHLHGGFPSLHAGTLALLDCADDADAIAGAVCAWEASALEDALAERGLCGARLRSAAEWRMHPQGVALQAVPLVTLTRIGDAPREALPGPPATVAGARPLSGVRVLDLTRVLAGPTCARTLAEHGADVLHVRSPALPSIEPFVVDTNVGKHSCHLDLDAPEDARRLRALVRDADVFAQGYRPGALARRGCSPAELAGLRPGIIVAALSCYGHDGPWSERPGWEQLAQTVSGMAHEHGATPPAVIPAAITDYTTGYLGALGVLCALARRAEVGGSWLVQVSLTRTAMWLLSLPRVEGDRPPAGVDRAALAPWWITMDSAWGVLRRLGPIARMSATPPRWDLPPARLGSHPAAWQPRDSGAST